MIKKIAIVSLSSGIMGESFVQHEVKIGLKRLKEYGIEVIIMPNADKGIDFIASHPEKRAEDLLAAIQDNSVDMILCAIGGEDTYRLLPYLFENDELKRAKENAGKDKVFLGFSDTTMNHLMLHKVGINSFYGQAFLPDLCEFEEKMLPYTAHYFEELIHTGTIKEIKPSDIWYEERTDWEETAVGTERVKHPDHGFELLQGEEAFSGEILGGCLESLYDIFDNSLHADSVELCQKYDLFPRLGDWKGKILLLETSEEETEPEVYRKMLCALKKTGIFKVISGIICGKPIDEKYYDEYNRILTEVVDDPDLSIVVNINVGHALPRCIIPFGVKAEVNAKEQVIRFDW